MGSARGRALPSRSGDEATLIKVRCHGAWKQKEHANVYKGMDLPANTCFRTKIKQECRALNATYQDVRGVFLSCFLSSMRVGNLMQRIKSAGSLWSGDFLMSGAQLG